MVHRYKDYNNPPAALVDVKWDALKANILIEKGSHDVDSKCYRDTTIEPLRILYKSKCAICERDRGFELQVDHYRPKKERNYIQSEYNQPGYYWLVYEWSNLIPLCSACNVKKSNKFPIRKNRRGLEIRVSTHTFLASFAPFNVSDARDLGAVEYPLLVNPEIELNPERHFWFNPDTTMAGRTMEGAETIRVCQLNGKELRRQRLKLRQYYAERITSAMEDFITHRNDAELRGELKAVFKDLKSGCHQDEPFSLFSIYLYKYFDLFIVSKLPLRIRGVVQRYFNEFSVLR